VGYKLPEELWQLYCTMSLFRRQFAKGDLPLMKKLAAETEEQLKQVGDVRSALEYLKIEIAKLSHKK
jgi:Domain of unknown function (DUF1843)